MQIKKLLLLILIIPCLTYAQYDQWLGWSNWLTKDREDRSPIAVWRAGYGITTVDTGGIYPTVSNWLSTNGLYDAVQTTANKRPLYNYDSLALKFDGVDDGLWCNDGGVFNPRTGDFSAFVWAYIPYEYGVSKSFLNKGRGDNTTYTGWRLMIQVVDTNNNLIRFIYSLSSSNYVLYNGSIIFHGFTTGGWFHVGVVADRDDTYSLYVNGVKVYSVDISAYANEDIQSSYNFKIGENYAGNYSYLSLIAEARYYNIALTESEIQALYNAGRPK